MNFAVLPASRHSQAKLVQRTQPSKPNTCRSDSASAGPCAASGNTLCHSSQLWLLLLFVSLLFLSLNSTLRGFTVGQPEGGMVLDLIPGVCTALAPNTPLSLLHKLYVTLPSSSDASWNYHVECILYMNRSHTQLSATLLFPG